MTDELTPSENAILIILMAEDREILNTEFTNDYRVVLRKASRDKLNRLGLIKTYTPEKILVHRLEDKGWARVQQDLDFVSSTGRAMGLALAILHTNLRDRVLPRTRFRNFTEMFARSDLVAAEGPNLEPRIRNAYNALAAEPKAWVALSRLRPFFGDVSTDDLDAALRRLERAPDVNIVPESNQKVLTAADRNAAVHIGGQDKHLLAIGV
jgi:hypothetical protein